MKIECILRRPGGTIVDLGGKRYHFAPMLNDGASPHVADVDDEAHAKRLLSIREAYRPADGAAVPQPAALVNKTADAIVLTVPQPPNEAALIDVLTALGATDPQSLLSVAWPDLFPPQEKPATPPAAPAAPAPETSAKTAAPTAAPAAPTLVIGAVAPSVGTPEPNTPPTAQPPIVAAPGSQQPQADDREKRLDAMDDDALRAEYVKVTGKTPHHKAGRDTMIARILATLDEA